MPTTPDDQNALLPPTSPARVMLVTTELRMGGAEKCLVNLATGMDRRRFTPTVVSLKRRPSADNCGLLRKLESADIPVHFLNINTPLDFLFSSSALKRLSKEIQPDIVQSFLFHANGMSAIATRSLGIGRHVAGIRVADPSAFRHRIEKWLCRDTRKFVCVSRAVESFSRETAGLDADKLVTIPNGIDLNAADKLRPAGLQEFGIKPDRKAIVFVGRLHEQKGLVEFFEHLDTLFERLPQHDLLLVGDGPLKNNLQATAAANSWSDRVHFAGWRADAMNIVAACQLLVLPSRWEGMPNALMEAMSLGKPVVSFDVQGVSELLGENTSGDVAALQVCEPHNYEEFVNNVEQIAGNEQTCLLAGHQNREQIRSHFSLATMIGNYQDLYVEILNADN